MHQSFRDGFEKQAAPGLTMSTWAEGNALAKTLRKSRNVASEALMPNPYQGMKLKQSPRIHSDPTQKVMPAFNPKPTPPPQAQA